MWRTQYNTPPFLGKIKCQWNLQENNEWESYLNKKSGYVWHRNKNKTCLHSYLIELWKRNNTIIIHSFPGQERSRFNAFIWQISTFNHKLIVVLVVPYFCDAISYFINRLSMKIVNTLLKRFWKFTGMNRKSWLVFRGCKCSIYKVAIKRLSVHIHGQVSQHKMQMIKMLHMN